MQIAIVEDRPEDAAELSALLGRYCAEREICAEETRFSSAEGFLAGFSLAFLDIYLDGMGGMEAARQVSALDPGCRLIFCTISAAHAVESYEVRAAYYLIKPLEYQRFCQAMDAACAGLLRESRCLTVASGGVEVQPLLGDILYMDCAAERTRLHLEGRMLPVNGTFSQVSAGLDGRFLCCNRNVTVNMDWVVELREEEFLLKTGQTVPIRRRGGAAVKKAFLAYSLRALRREDGL